MDNHTYIVKERLVLTYEPEAWPVGIITGYLTDDNGFNLEHIISFDSHYLLRLGHAGLREAINHNLDYVRFYVPRDFPLARQLDILARRLGFQMIDSDHVINTYCYWIAK